MDAYKLKTYIVEHFVGNNIMITLRPLRDFREHDAKHNMEYDTIVDEAKITPKG